MDRELHLSFYTNSITVGRGFYIEFLQQLCLTGSSHTSKPGFTYPHLPSTHGRSNDGSRLNESGDATTDQPSSFGARPPPTYPPDYVARSNPVRDMIEAPPPSKPSSHSSNKAEVLHSKPLFAGNVIITHGSGTSPNFLQQLQSNANVTANLRSSYKVI